MSKLPVEEEDLPPPYSSVSAQNPIISPHIAAINAAAADFSARLNDLALQLASAREARNLAREQNVSDSVALITPYLEGMLSSLANMNPVPQLFETVIVPAQAVGEDWEFSDEDDNRRLLRIEQEIPNNKLDDDRKRPSGLDFEEPPESGLWWWDDEHMARRLARSLQPRRVTRQAVRQRVKEAKEVKKASRWGFFKKPETPPPEAAPLPTPTSTASYEEGDDPRMTVLAEEVTFRKENEMGIWESQSGWGLVVTVRLK